jgi:hypothetical protein
MRSNRHRRPSGDQPLEQFRWTTPCLAVVLGFAVVIGLAACGDDGASDTQAGGAPPRVAQTAGFPSPASRSFRELLRGMPQGPDLALGVGLLQPGRNRFAFALFDRDNRQIGEVKVALYFAAGLDEPARGPWPARYERLSVKPQFRSKQSENSPDTARSVYVCELRLPGPGSYAMAALAKLGGTLVSTPPVQVVAAENSRVPGVGDRAIRIHTPTRASVGGRLSLIDTRMPPDSMHEVDLANALDRHRPILLLFATPALTHGRVSAAVTDIAEQVKSQYEGRVDFIHMEIYTENDPSKGERPQVKAWHLENEPFAFAINRRGRIAARLEGAFSAGELRAAVRRALR